MKTIDDVLEIQGNNLWAVTPESSVIKALKLMTEKNVDALPVLKLGKLVGIISESDCLAEGLFTGKSLDKTSVFEIMAQNTASTTPAQTLEECLTFMIEQDIRYLPVLEDDACMGLVSLGDLYGPIVAEQKEYIYRLENYVTGHEYNE